MGVWHMFGKQESVYLCLSCLPGWRGNNSFNEYFGCQKGAILDWPHSFLVLFLSFLRLQGWGSAQIILNMSSENNPSCWVRFPREVVVSKIFVYTYLLFGHGPISPYVCCSCFQLGFWEKPPTRWGKYCTLGCSRMTWNVFRQPWIPTLKIWVFPKIMVPQNGWFIMGNPIKMDDLGIPLFLETPICMYACYWAYWLGRSPTNSEPEKQLWSHLVPHFFS